MHKPSHVISILDGDEKPPAFLSALPPEDLLAFNGACGGADCAQPSTERIKTIIDFAARWAADDRRQPLLIHCHQGVARSMGIAYVALCAVSKEQCEYKIAERLRAAAPHAEPNVLLVSEADDLLSRDGRMVEAILDMSPCCATVAAPIVVLPVAA